MPFLTFSTFFKLANIVKMHEVISRDFSWNQKTYNILGFCNGSAFYGKAFFLQVFCTSTFAIKAAFTCFVGKPLDKNAHFKKRSLKKKSL